MEHDKFLKQPVGDIENLKRLAKLYREKPEFTMEDFFSHALLGFYDGAWSHLTRDTGHVVYRLSDFVPEEERKQMKIYPGSDGSILVEVDEEGEEYRWHSLEDFRSQWERYHPEGIPLYTPKLLSGVELDKQNK